MIPLAIEVNYVHEHLTVSTEKGIKTRRKGINRRTHLTLKGLGCKTEENSLLSDSWNYTNPRIDMHLILMYLRT